MRRGTGCSCRRFNVPVTTWWRLRPILGPPHCRTPRRMSSVLFRSLHARFDASGVRGLFTPRKPRNPLLRVALGLVGVAVVAVLLVVDLCVGAAMGALGRPRGVARNAPTGPGPGTR